MISLNCEYTEFTQSIRACTDEPHEKEQKIRSVFRRFSRIVNHSRLILVSQRRREDPSDVIEISTETLLATSFFESWKNWHPNLSEEEVRVLPHVPVFLSGSALQLASSIFHSLLKHSKYLQRLLQETTDGDLRQEKKFVDLSSFSKETFFSAINLFKKRVITSSNYQGATLLEFLLSEDVVFKVDPSFFKALKVKDTMSAEDMEFQQTQLLVDIDLSGEKISNIEALCYFPKACSLSLAKNKKIKNFTPLFHLKELITLNLERTNIEDLSGIEQLNCLEQINLYDCIKIKTISHLVNLPNIRNIDIRQIMIEDLRVLQEFSCRVRATIYWFQRHSREALDLRRFENIELEVLTEEDFMREWIT